MGIANQQNMTRTIPVLPQPYGIRVRLRPGDPFAKLVGADWQKTHWFFTAAERDRTLLYPLSQTKLNAQLWGVAAIGFAVAMTWNGGASTSVTPSIKVKYRDGCMLARCAHSASKSSSVAPGSAAARATTSSSDNGGGAGGRSRCR